MVKKTFSPCCIFGICCPPSEQFEALVQEFTNLGFSPEDARTGATWAQETFTEAKFKAAIEARDKG